MQWRAQDAIDRGLFRTKDADGIARQTSPPDMEAICWTASEVARGMAHLHSRKVVHGGEPTAAARGHKVKHVVFGSRVTQSVQRA